MQNRRHQNKVFIVKSQSAAKVLQLMDSHEDGDGRYNEFVKLVAGEDNVSVEELEKELDKYI